MPSADLRYVIGFRYGANERRNRVSNLGSGAHWLWLEQPHELEYQQPSTSGAHRLSGDSDRAPGKGANAR
jgi:hypothetical protein